MHRKKSNRWSKLFSTAGIIALLFGGLIVQSVRAVSSNPLPVCTGATCTVTFDSTGDYFAWNPPAGAKNISFDLMGAQGGRNGGLGGRLTGSIPTAPSTLFIYVGGLGAQGAGANGGFNGGGKAGSGRGDEGSGGGATDIRTGTALADRIAVAAGGGGTGGFFGGTGGAAGGLNGSGGISGQGQGGAGASQTAGGNGGYPNGGSWGDTGQLGVGGTGGTSTMAGGGGGGGGYFGGGGGGADLDACCSNAGGGGGGSSWSHSTQVTSATHTAAYRTGAGLAVITYVVPPSLNSFIPAKTITNSPSVNYNLVFNESVTGLATADFSTSGSSATCSNVAISGSGTTYTVQVTGCSAGTYKLALLANSVMGAISGPAIQISAIDVVIDLTAPTVIGTAPQSPSSAAVLRFDLAFSEAVTDLTITDFTVSGVGCEVQAPIGSGSNYIMQITNCTDTALVQLALKASAVTDLAGNTAPSSVIQFAAVQLDRVAPVGAWGVSDATTYINPNFEITFPEVISSLSVSSFGNVGGASGCLLSLTENAMGTRYTISTTNCSDGSVQISMATGAYSDALGNRGPVSASVSRAINKIPQPVPIQTQAPAPVQTQAPAPIQTQAPAPLQAPNPAPVADSPSPITASPITSGPVTDSPANPSTSAAETDEPQELAGAVTPKSYSFSSLEILTPDLPSKIEQSSPSQSFSKDSATSFPPLKDQAQSVSISTELGIWFAWLLVVIGIIGVFIGLVRLAQGVRTKGLVRKLA